MARIEISVNATGNAKTANALPAQLMGTGEILCPFPPTPWDGDGRVLEAARSYGAIVPALVPHRRPGVLDDAGILYLPRRIKDA